MFHKHNYLICFLCFYLRIPIQTSLEPDHLQLWFSCISHSHLICVAERELQTTAIKSHTKHSGNWISRINQTEKKNICSEWFQHKTTDQQITELIIYNAKLTACNEIDLTNIQRLWCKYHFYCQDWSDPMIKHNVHMFIFLCKERCTVMLTYIYTELREMLISRISLFFHKAQFSEIVTLMLIFVTISVARNSSIKYNKKKTDTHY